MVLDATDFKKGMKVTIGEFGCDVWTVQDDALDDDIWLVSLDGIVISCDYSKLQVREETKILKWSQIEAALEGLFRLKDRRFKKVKEKLGFEQE
jgi:hypothetical protein